MLTLIPSQAPRSRRTRSPSSRSRCSTTRTATSCAARSCVPLPPRLDPASLSDSALARADAQVAPAVAALLPHHLLLDGCSGAGHGRVCCAPLFSPPRARPVALAHLSLLRLQTNGANLFWAPRASLSPLFHRAGGRNLTLDRLSQSSGSTRPRARPTRAGTSGTSASSTVLPISAALLLDVGSLRLSTTGTSERSPLPPRSSSSPVLLADARSRSPSPAGSAVAARSSSRPPSRRSPASGASSLPGPAVVRERAAGRA